MSGILTQPKTSGSTNSGSNRNKLFAVVLVGLIASSGVGIYAWGGGFTDNGFTAPTIFAPNPSATPAPIDKTPFDEDSPAPTDHPDPTTDPTNPPIDDPEAEPLDPVGWGYAQSANYIVDSRQGSVSLWYGVYNASSARWVTAWSTVNSTATIEYALSFMTAGALLLNQVAFDNALMASIPEDVKVICNYEDESYVYINPLDSAGSPWTVSVGSGVNNGLYTAEDGKGRIAFTSTNQTYTEERCMQSLTNGGKIITKECTWDKTIRSLANVEVDETYLGKTTVYNSQTVSESVIAGNTLFLNSTGYFKANAAPDSAATFGYSSVGTSQFNNALFSVTSFTCADNGVISKLSFYMSGASTAATVMAVIYDNAGNSLFNSSIATISTTLAWVNFDVSNVPVVAGNVYKLGTIANTTLTHKYIAGSANQLQCFNVTYPNVPASLGVPDYQYATQISLYATVITSTSTLRTPAILLAAQTASASTPCLCLKEGYFTSASWSWTGIGQPLYVDDVAGGLTQAYPNAGGNSIQLVGYAVNATTIYFNPSLEWVTLE